MSTLLIDRRTFISGVTLSLLASPPAEAQQARGTARLGVLVPGSPSDPTRELDAFKRALGERGWNEGRNVALEVRWAKNPEGFSNLATELVRLGVDVIISAGPAATVAAIRATSTVPIVMIAYVDLRDVGAASLAHPGGNVTGLTIGQADVMGEKRLQLVTETLPGISRVVILWDAKELGGRDISPGLLAAARLLKVQLQRVDVTSIADFDEAFRIAKQGGAGAIMVSETSRMFANRTLIAELGLRHRLPVVSLFSPMVKAGALMSYAADLSDQAGRAAFYVDKILKGAKPADLPIEQPTKFELVINLKTAKALGLTIPPSLLQRADQVIE